MRYGLFSDVHSNLEAMTVVAGALRKEGVQERLCLGDLVGYYASPQQTLDLIQSMDCWKVVLGNHDAACLGKTPLARFNEPAARAILWTREKLLPRHYAFLSSLRLREEIGDMDLVHASPHEMEEWHYLTQPEDLERNFRHFPGKICFFGHVHKPFIAEREPGGAIRVIPDADYALKPHCRYLVNVGSVGQPRDGDRRTAFVVYDSTAGAISIRRLEYDFERTMQKAKDAGLPDLLAQRLRAGK
ncbi:MAG TPA: metallophosphoesterase family protein [bacterium]|nr:metallophosphoesterase family protein [bacterium]